MYSRFKSSNPDEELKAPEFLGLKRKKSEDSALSKVIENDEDNTNSDGLKKCPVAVMYFRFSHRDKDDKPLTNRQQAAIVEDIHQNIHKINSDVTKSQFSSTIVPFYDSGENGDNLKVKDSKDTFMKRVRSFDKIHDELIKNGIASLEKPHLIYNPNDYNSSSITSFTPFNTKEISSIISEMQAIMISRLLPLRLRLREWKRIYSIDVDGVSLSTFYKNTHGYSDTIILVQDNKGWKFGGYTTSEWGINKYFYGTGESFLFTFKDTEEDLAYFKWTGANDNIQYSDESSIAIGGHTGKFALYLRKNLLYGTSRGGETFSNDILSSEENFDGTKLEVWGFDAS